MSFTVINTLGEGLVIAELTCEAFITAYQAANANTVVGSCNQIEPGYALTIVNALGEKFDWLIASAAEFVPATMDFNNPAMVGQALLICCCVFALLFGIRQGRTG